MREPRQPRALTDPLLASWRRRTSFYLRSADPQTRAILRLLPVLLGARFRRPGLDREPPGLMRMPRRRRWGRLCERVELPPPQSFANGPPLIRSIVVVPKITDYRQLTQTIHRTEHASAPSFEVLLFVVDDLSAQDTARLNERIASLSMWLERRAPTLSLRVAANDEFTPTVAALAAVAAGEMPPETSGAFDLAQLLARAHEPRTKFLGLLAAHAASTHAFSKALRASHWLFGTSIDAGLARWSQESAARELLFIEQMKPVSPAQLVLTSANLRRAQIVALRRLHPKLRATVRARLNEGDHPLASRLPRVLHPTFLEFLDSHRASEVQLSKGWELRFDDVPLLRAKTLDQLRVRAICESPALAHETSEWRRVAALVTQGLRKRAVVVVQPSFLKHLLVTIGTSQRPRAQRLESMQLTETCLALRSRGYSLEVLTSAGAQKPLASRLTRLASLVVDGHELGMQLGDRLLVATHGHTRNLSLSSAFARPRRLRWLPEHAEWAAAFRLPAGGPSARFQAIQATVWPSPTDPNSAALLAVDQRGRMFYERIERDRLELALHELRSLLAPTSFSVSVSPELQQLGGRRADDLPTVLFDVECDWPRGLTLCFEGERFGSGRGEALPWAAAAQTVFSRWPPGVGGRIGVKRVTWRQQPTDMSPLHLLAVRSRVLRRLSVHLGHLSRALRAA